MRVVVLTLITLSLGLTACMGLECCGSGNALHFPGARSGYVHTPITTFPARAFTVMAWMRSTDVGPGSGQAQTLLSYAAPDPNSGGGVADNALWFSVPLPSIMGLSSDPFPLPPGGNDRWVHYALSWDSDSGNVLGYIDGLLAVNDTVAANATLPSPGILILGQDQDTLEGGFDSTQALRGAMDDLRVYSVVIPPDQIAQRATEPLLGAPKPSDLFLYFAFDEPQGTPYVDDAFGNARLTFKASVELPGPLPILVPSALPVRLGGHIASVAAADSLATAAHAVLDLLPCSNTDRPGFYTPAQAASLQIDYSSSLDPTALATLASAASPDPDFPLMYGPGSDSGTGSPMGGMGSSFALPVSVGPPGSFPNADTGSWGFSYSVPSGSCSCSQVSFAYPHPTLVLPENGGSSGTFVCQEDGVSRIDLSAYMQDQASLQPLYHVSLVLDVLPSRGVFSGRDPANGETLPLTLPGVAYRVPDFLLEYHPNPDVFGQAVDNVTLRLISSSGALSPPYTLVFDVVEVNDAPVFSSPPRRTLVEDQTELVALDISDVDSGTYIAYVTGLPGHGTLHMVDDASPGPASLGRAITETYKSWELGEPVEQWVSQVVAYSTIYGEDAWGPPGILGPPDSDTFGFPPSCFSALSPFAGAEYVTLRFETPVYLQSIVIHECNAGGTITSLAVSSSASPSTPEMEVWSGPGKTDLPLEYYVWSAADVCGPRSAVDTLTIYYDTTVGSRGWGGFDAVKLIGEIAPRSGAIQNTADSLFYTPDPDFFGTDSFQVSFTDCISISCNQARLVGPFDFVVDVLPVNDDLELSVTSYIPSELATSAVVHNATVVPSDTFSVIQVSIVVKDANQTLDLSVFASEPLPSGSLAPPPLTGWAPVYQVLDWSAVTDPPPSFISQGGHVYQDLSLGPRLESGTPLVHSEDPNPPPGTPRTVVVTLAVDAPALSCQLLSSEYRSLFFNVQIGDVVRHVQGVVTISCPTCPAGYVLSGGRGSSACIACSAGTYSVGGMASSCANCPMGSSSLAASSSCTLCDPGSYAPYNASQCLRCPSTGYAISPGSSVCALCPTHETTGIRGATTSASCTCAPGFYRDLTSFLPRVEEAYNVTFPVSENEPGYESLSLTDKHVFGPCLACPAGAYCMGGFDRVTGMETQPIAEPGYWINPEDSHQVYQCRTDRACPGGPPGTCAREFEGHLCGRCTDGFYASHEECLDCGPVPWLPLCVALVIAVGTCCMVAVIYFKFPNAIVVFNTNQRKMREGFVLVSILVEFLQVASVLQTLRGWSSPFLLLLYAASTMQLNLELLRLDCIFSTVGFVTTGIIISALPAVLTVIALGIVNSTSSVVGRNFLTSFFLYVARFVLVAVLGTLASYLICYKQPNLDNYWSMVTRPDVRCFVSDSDWTAVTPVSTLFLALYATVSPGFLWYIVHKMVSTRSPALMFRYSSLVFSFRDDARYGAFVIVIRKIAVVLVAPVLAFQIPYEVASGKDTFPAVAIALVVAGFLIHHVRSWPYHWKSCNVAEMVAYSGLLTLLLLFHIDAPAVHVTVFALVMLFFVVAIGHFFYKRYSRRFLPSRDTTELAQQREREMAFLQRSQKSLFLPGSVSPTASAKKLNQVAPMAQNTLSPYGNSLDPPKTLVKTPPAAAHLPPGPTTLHGTFLGEGPLPDMMAQTSGRKPPLGKDKGKNKKKNMAAAAAASSAENGGSIQLLTVYESGRSPPPVAAAAATPHGADSSTVMSFAHFVSSQMDIELGDVGRDHEASGRDGGGDGGGDGEGEDGEEKGGGAPEKEEEGGGGELESSILASSSTSSSSLDLGSASS